MTIFENSPTSITASPAPTKWQTRLSLILALLLLGVGGWYLSQKITLAELILAFRQANPWLIMLAVLVFILTNFAKTKRWQILYTQETPSFAVLFWALNLGQYVNLVLPLVRLGEVARIYALEQKSLVPVSKWLTLGTLVVEKSLDLLIIALTVVGLLPFMVLPLSVVSRSWQLAVAVALILLCLVAVSRNPSVLFPLIQQTLPTSLAERLCRWIRAGLEGIAALHNGRSLFHLFIWCLLIGLLSILTPYFLFRAFAMPFGLVEATLLHLGATAVAVPPSTPAKFGVIEFAVLFLLTQFGSHDPALNLSYALLFHLVIILPQLALGLIATMWLGKSKRGFAE